MTADRQSEQLCFFETHFTTERSIEPVKTIALANQKGGVGKTTTAASLGIGLSRQGKKVLLIDADAQGNLTQMLGWSQPDELSPTLSTLMEKIIAELPITPDEGILRHPSGVHLVPANIELSALEVTLVNTMSRETVLRQYLSTVADRYDYALIDCMPSLGMLTINALTAADSVIIPVQVSPRKGAGTAFANHHPRETAAQPEAGGGRHCADDGGQPHHAGAGDQRACPQDLWRSCVRKRDPPFHQGGRD